MRLRPFVTQLDWYVFRQIVVALLVVTFGLTALIWLVQSLRFVELVVNHGLSLWVFIKLTALLIPSFIAVILPITTFVVVLFIYQRLLGDRELTVMRSMGLSPFALSRPVLVLALLITALGYWLNLSVVPASLHAFGQFQWEIRNRLAAFLLQEGVFTTVSNELTVYVRARDPDGTLHGVLVDDARDKSARATILAERGRLIDAPDGLHVLLYDGSREQVDRQTKRLNILTFKENVVDLTGPARDQAGHVMGMSEQSLSSLLHPPPTLSAVDHNRWIAEAHKRLSAPIATVTYALVALWAALRGAFSRHGGVMRPLVAVGVVVGLVATNLAFQSLGSRENGLLVLLWGETLLPPLVFTVMLFGPRIVPGWRAPLPRTA
jgi:lipopolysaccharide export system permease protein